MGTRGYRVYRHRGYFFVFYNHADSYPDILGLGMWGSIPIGRTEEEFMRWVDNQRSHWDNRLEKKLKSEFYLSVSLKHVRGQANALAPNGRR